VPQDFLTNALISLVPTVGVGLIFWFIMRAIIRADRTERKVYSKVEAQERARMEEESSKP
jgi:flagellar biosynthesis/type III secretory pathway M-ring protein FliF/YscJ